MKIYALGKSLAGLAAVVFIGGFLSAALVRYSPGFGVDENYWNPKISAATRAAQHAALERENRLPSFYLRYVGAALHGDFGVSDSLKAPVSELLLRRAPVTLSLIGWGTAGGLILGGFFAWLAVWPRRATLTVTAAMANGLMLAVPPAVLAILFYNAEFPVELALALALVPRLFGTLRTMLGELAASPALLAARARGLGTTALATRYILAPALPRLAALVGVAVVLAFGFAIPVESLCDQPGVGQLAWQAATARDLPLLCGLALIITFIVAVVQSLGELAGERA